MDIVDENDNDSVEGVMFTKDKAVIMTGTFTNTYEPGKLNRMGLWYKPWFYKVRLRCRLKKISFFDGKIVDEFYVCKETCINRQRQKLEPLICIFLLVVQMY